MEGNVAAWWCGGRKQALLIYAGVHLLGVLAAGGRSQNNDFEPPWLYAMVQLLHTTYQKGLGKSLPNKLTY